MFYNSQLAYKQAIKSIPGGVNSPVRAFRSVDSTPVFFKSGNSILQALVLDLRF